MYDCQTYVWHNITLPAASQKPDPRSSFSFLPHDAGAVLCGGYSRTRSIVAAGKQTKGRDQGTRSVLKPTVHQDSWFLRIMQLPPDAAPGVPPAVRWERRKKAANSPHPARAGATMVHHKGRGILLGGVHDVEESEECIDSEFFDTLFAWNIERNRYFQLNLRRARAVVKQPADMAAKRGRGKADEAELLRNLAALQTKGSVADSESVSIHVESNKDISMDKPTKAVWTSMPHPRFNAQLAIQDDMLYIFGGTFERGDVEYTFDEMWAIDLRKMDGVQEIFRRELDDWRGSDNEESDSYGDEEESDEEDEGENGEPMAVALPLAEAKDVPNTEESPENDQPNLERTDTRPQPRPFESLRDFFTRTSATWQEVALERLRDGARADMSIKEARKEAFDFAESKWWDVREDIIALEDRQEDAGIGDIISIMDRGSEIGGVGRRR